MHSPLQVLFIHFQVGKEKGMAMYGLLLIVPSFALVGFAQSRHVGSLLNLADFKENCRFGSGCFQPDVNLNLKCAGNPKMPREHSSLKTSK